MIDAIRCLEEIRARSVCDEVTMRLDGDDVTITSSFSDGTAYQHRFLMEELIHTNADVTEYFIASAGKFRRVKDEIRSNTQE